MAIKLTPERLRRLVLEEKKKMMDKDSKAHKLDPKAKKEMNLEMDEESWDKAPLAHKREFKPGDKPTLKEMRALREQEELLRNRLRRLQERRLAIRRQLISELD